MQGLILFLAGFVAGGFIVRLLMQRSLRTGMRPHEIDEQYQVARRVVRRHFLNHDTLHAAELERSMDIRLMTAQRYLDQLEREGVVRRHGHTRSGAFYTHA
jgi:Fic family protein